MSYHIMRVAIVIGHQWGDRGPESYEQQAQLYRKHAKECSNEHVTYDAEIFSGEASNVLAFEWVRHNADGGAIVFLSRSSLSDAEAMLQTLMIKRLHKRIRVWIFTGLLFEDRVNVLDIGAYDPQGWKYVVG